MLPQSQQSDAKMSYRVPPRGYMYAIRTNELIEKHLRDLDAKDWTVLQRHEYEREVRQRALQLIDQAVANYPEDVHLTGYMADLNWYYEYGDNLSTSSPATIQSSIRHQASLSREGESTFANKPTSVHKPNAEVRFELSHTASSQYSILSRTSERSIGDAETKENKVAVEREQEL
ncbi:hypothetical protein BOTCAL_0214g00040 [Botryotinia calthae]|uniref:Uncharacterized protein n=1 Tax=Botryotinia calthae TaxID=38488 RepID=A0A4Y8CZA7_9HELO|nr:hypothetical protein BOTCAL_0214g00040 [Botryotinia calthae]